ncbi:MAG: 30S ribosomal protein S5 [Patescibacteria group bacterium]
MDNPEENKIINEAVISTAPQIQASVGAVVALPKEAKKAFFAPMDRKKNTRKSGGREQRVKPEFDQKLINIRRVARVVAGGRRFSFSVAVITGNRKGLVGVGIGKAGDTALAIDKAVRNAKKNMITVRLTKKMSIPHEVECKFSSARIIIRPAPGKGVIAGSVARYVIDLAGIKDVSAKILSVSKNPLNIARATIAALEKISKPNAPKASLPPEEKKTATKELARKSE